MSNGSAVPPTKYIILKERKFNPLSVSHLLSSKWSEGYIGSYMKRFGF